MKKSILGLMTILLISLAGTGCILGPIVHGNGQILSEVRDVSGFDSVSIGGSGKAVVTQGDTEGLEIRADENLLPYILTEVSGGTLRIHLRRGNLRFSEPPVYRIKVRELSDLDLSGSLRAEMAHLRTDHFETGISGSGSVSLGNLTADDVDVRVSGSGDISIGGGTAKSLKIGVSGSGDTRASDFEVREAEVSISGSGSAKLWVTEVLKVSVSGSGTVDYRGSPQVTSSVSGSGRIRQDRKD